MKSGLNIQNWLWKEFRKKKKIQRRKNKGRGQAQGRAQQADPSGIRAPRGSGLGPASWAKWKQPAEGQGRRRGQREGSGGDSPASARDPLPRSLTSRCSRAPGARRRLVPRGLRSDPVAKAPEGRRGRAATRLGPASGAPTTPRGAMGRSKRPLPPSARDRAPRARVVPGRVGRARRGPAAPTGPAAAPWGGSGCSVQRGGEEGAGPEARGELMPCGTGTGRGSPCRAGRCGPVAVSPLSRRQGGPVVRRPHAGASLLHLLARGPSP